MAVGAKIPADIPPETLLDGEWMREGDQYIVFDVPVFAGVIHEVTLETRRAMLEDWMPRLGPCRLIQRLLKGRALEKAHKMGAEGIVLKRITDPYPQGETGCWVKVKE
jgi:ATP-dependent DNA ligase